MSLQKLRAKPCGAPRPWEETEKERPGPGRGGDRFATRSGGLYCYVLAAACQLAINVPSQSNPARVAQLGVFLQRLEPRRLHIAERTLEARLAIEEAPLATSRARSTVLITLTGDRKLASKMQTWLGLSPFARERNLVD